MGQSNPTNVNDSFAWRLALVYAAFFLIVGWHLPLFPVWLTARGLDPAAIGFVLAAMQAVRVVGTPLGTRIADRYGSLRAGIVVTTLASLIEERLRDDVEATHAIIHALNEWMLETWTFNYADRIFATPVGKAASAPSGEDARAVFKVTAASVPPLVTSTREALAVEERLRVALSEDILAQYIAQVEKDLGVTVYQQNLRRAVGGES